MFCAYAHKFQPTVWETCGTQSQKGWVVAFVLAMLPLLARLIQSVRRYADSKLVTHLINVSRHCLHDIIILSYYKNSLIIWFSGREVRLRHHLLFLLLSLAASWCVTISSEEVYIYHTMKLGVTDRGGSFVLWCLFGAVYSIYACTWVGLVLILQKCFLNSAIGFPHGLVVFQTSFEIPSTPTRARVY